MATYNPNPMYGPTPGQQVPVAPAQVAPPAALPRPPVTGPGAAQQLPPSARSAQVTGNLLPVGPKEEDVGAWDQLFQKIGSDVDLQKALFQGASNLLRNRRPGETEGAQITGAIAGGMQNYQDSQTQDSKRGRLDAASRRFDAGTAGQEIQNETNSQTQSSTVRAAKAGAGTAENQETLTGIQARGAAELQKYDLEQKQLGKDVIEKQLDLMDAQIDEMNRSGSAGNDGGVDEFKATKYAHLITGKGPGDPDYDDMAVRLGSFFQQSKGKPWSEVETDAKLQLKLGYLREGDPARATALKILDSMKKSHRKGTLTGIAEAYNKKKAYERKKAEALVNTMADPDNVKLLNDGKITVEQIQASHAQTWPDKEFF